jgi:dephospho-CoA kinase
MLRVGLTGGYATGKSLVAHELQRLGCHVIYADELGHRVLLPNGEAYAPVVTAFGPAILDEDARIDRKKLAAVVFGDAPRLATLTGIVHPAVFHLEESMMQQIALTDPHGITVIEAAILIEAKRSHFFDKLILTTCDEEVQIARGMNRDHATREQVLARLANQMSVVEKRKYADYVVDTSGTKEETVRQVTEIYAELSRLAEAKSR